MPFPLTNEQRAVVEDRGGALLVSAAAGSGKTRVLVERLLERVEQEKLDIDNFLVITFTNAAAAELRGRIAQELTQRLALNPHDRHLRKQTMLVYKARICTIDALCIDLLHQYGYLIGVDPDFRICDQAESEAIAQQVLNDLLDECYEHIHDDSEFTTLIDQILTGRDDSRLADIVLDIHARIQSDSDPEQWLMAHKDDFFAAGIDDAGRTPWGELILRQAKAQAAYWRDRIAEALVEIGEDEVLNINYAPSLSETLDALEKLCNAVGWEQAAACLPVPFPRVGVKRGADPVLKEQVAELRKLCKTRMETVASQLGADSAVVLQELRDLAPAIGRLFALVLEFERRFFQEKTTRGILEFSDAEHLSVQLLQMKSVRDLFRDQFVEIMVDEYQDTNEVQNVLFDALSRDGKNLFLVGDVKQSIYRFRLADPTIFLRKYEAWAPALQAKMGEERKLVLSRNFRSRPEVLHGANFVFETIMSRECGEMVYGEEETLVPGGSFAEDPSYAVEFNVIDLPETENGEDKVDKNLIEARFVARRMAQMLREGFPVQADEGGTRPVRSSDMVILMRSPGPVLRHYIRALGEAGIPVETESGDNFFETTEISIVLSLLKIIDNPRQDVPLLSVLRSPLFPEFTPDRLAQIRAGEKEGDFYSALETDTGEDSKAFIKELEQLRKNAGEKPAYRLIEDLYSKKHLMALFGSMPGGEERKANLAALREHARRLDQGGHIGLYGFLSQLERMRQRGDPMTAASAGVGGVKILSIHRSKGLEFPVVFLCGMGRQFNKMDATAPMLFHSKLGVGPKCLRRGEGWTTEWPTLARQAVALQMERELKAEEMRLLYVAMTRAKEKLIMTMGLAKAGNAISKLARDAQRPVAPAVVASAATPGTWMLLCALTRPESDALYAVGEVVPKFSEDCGPAWDIRVLHGEDFEIPLHAAGHVGGEICHMDEAQVDALSKVFEWTYPNANVAELPSKLTATQLKGRDLDAEAAEGTFASVRVKSTSFRKPNLSRGTEEKEAELTATERGTALHKVMQYLDFDKTGSLHEINEEIKRLVERQFITKEEGMCADASKILRFFDSDLGRELRNAPIREREYKFSMLVPVSEYFAGVGGEEKVLFQGVIDCWFGNEKEITILDFKTDRIPNAEQYRPQVEGYAKALKEQLGKEVKRTALYFFATENIFYFN